MGGSRRYHAFSRPFGGGTLLINAIGCVAKRGQDVDADRRGEIGGSSRRVDLSDERRQGAAARRGDPAQRLPKGPFQGNARAMAGDRERMLIQSRRSRRRPPRVAWLIRNSDCPDPHVSRR